MKLRASYPALRTFFMYQSESKWIKPGRPPGYTTTPPAWKAAPLSNRLSTSSTAASFASMRPYTRPATDRRTSFLPAPLDSPQANRAADKSASIPLPQPPSTGETPHGPMPIPAPSALSTAAKPPPVSRFPPPALSSPLSYTNSTTFYSERLPKSPFFQTS